MKNIKNTLTAMTMAAVLGVSAISVNAGIIVSDRTTGDVKTECAPKGGGILQQLAGIIIIGVNSNSLTGIIVSDRDGIIVSDKGCQASQERDGIIVSD